MDKNNIIELTNKLYKLTLLFPKKEPLRYRMRERGNRILENFISWEVSKSLAKPNAVRYGVERDDFLIFEIKNDLEIISSYFEIAKWQNWVSYFEILEIKEKYDKIKSDLSEPVENFEPEQGLIQLKPLKPEQNKKPDFSKGLGARKEKILEILKQKEKIQVWELNKVLPDVSKRTLRRDFEQLLKQGLVERNGQGNHTFYTLTRT